MPPIPQVLSFHRILHLPGVLVPLKMVMGLCLVLQGTRMNSHQLLGASHLVGWDRQPGVPIVTSPSMPSVSRWWHRRGEEIVSLSPLWLLGHKQAAPRRALQGPEVRPDSLLCSGALHMSPAELDQEGAITVSSWTLMGTLEFLPLAIISSHRALVD